jgi:hypothetical protein
MGDLFYVDERDVPFASFDPAHVGTVNAAHIGKLLLGQTELFPFATYGPTKPAAYVFHGVVLMVKSLQPIGPHPMSSILFLTCQCATPYHCTL